MIILINGNGKVMLVWNVFYNWKIDYDAIAAAVLKRFRGEDKDSQPYYIVYNVDYTVGFANQFRSLSGIFLIALVSGRRLRSMMLLISLIISKLGWLLYCNG